MSAAPPLFERAAVLKSDVFSTVERGVAVTATGERLPAIRRDLSTARWWAWPLARHFAAREARALRRAAGIPGVPPLIHADRRTVIRGFVDGLPMQAARPRGDAAFFRSARRLLRRLRRAGIAHNDLAKEPNWLVTPQGEAAVVDLQLASLHRPGRSRLLRVLAYEDLRHLLKHKRKYHPEGLTATERRILARKSLFARLWMRTGKPLYRLVTHRLLGMRDREGGGLRLLADGPRIEAAARSHPAVREIAVVAFPFRRDGIGLHAFVVADPAAALDAAALRAHLRARLPPGVAPPERIRRVPALPRDAAGAIARPILTLIATGQTDQLAPLIGGDAPCRAAVEAILAAPDEEAAERAGGA
ncbi:serine/threonine protein kinase [Caldovatus sediminis]|uniref:Serine/threonine protein kinase n=1 Tax=Caldovatus sediminis TaxID=2041189 RepID=A0A8J2Z9D6_9PROT|nr:serine/threonine protein kinase [Caldovatus sediminis]GGG21571.1 serine/threonine protein kinase [Caldovatus sediminis]